MAVIHITLTFRVERASSCLHLCTIVQDIPRLEIPLHTLIELVPKPDGRMAEERIPFDPVTGRIGEVGPIPCGAH